MTIILRKRDDNVNAVRSVIKILILTVTICLTIYGPVYAHDKVGQSFTALGDDGLVWICGYYGTDSCVIYGVTTYQHYEISIPSMMASPNGKLKVVGIISDGEMLSDTEDNHCFGLESVKTLIIPNTISFIGKYAFSEYENLTEIRMPDNSAIEIEDRAFYECTGLKKISFPKGSTVSSSALEGCTGLETIINAPGCIDLGINNNEPSIKKIVFADGVKRVDGVSCEVWVKTDEPGFEHTNAPATWKLTDVVLPNGLEELGSNCFYGCESLSNINIPSSIKRIEEYAFYGCVGLKNELSLHNLEYVGDGAFMGCKNIKLSVRHPGNLRYQYKDSGITDIIIDLDKKDVNYNEILPGGLTGCPNLKSINVVGGNGGYKTVDGVLYVPLYESQSGKSAGWSLAKYPAGKSGGSYSIPADVRTVGGFAFDGCQFTEIHVPPTVEYLFREFMGSIYGIDKSFYAFDNMQTNPLIYVVSGSAAEESLKSSQYSDRIRYEYGPEVLITYNLNGGKNNSSNPAKTRGGMEVTLKDPTRDGYTFVGWRSGSDDTAQKNYKLVLTGEEITKGKTVEAVWEKKAENQKAAKEIKVGNSQFKLINSSQAQYVKPTKKKASVSIPATITSGGKKYKVTSIAANAFKKNTIVKNITIGANVTTIGKNAFYGCKNLTTVKGAKSIKSIGSSAFAGCSKLTSVTLGSKLTTIGAKAFYNDKTLTKITIPAKTKKIGKSAFQGCKKLKSITIKSTKLTEKNVGANAFKGIQAKAIVTVPKKVLKVYKKWFTKKGLPKKAKIK